MRSLSPLWKPTMKLCSCLPPYLGLDTVWVEVEEYRSMVEGQHQRWMCSYVEERLVRLTREAGRGEEVAQL